MSDFIIALLLGGGAAIYVYSYFSKRATGGDFKKTVTPAIMAGALVFVVMLIVLKSVLSD